MPVEYSGALAALTVGGECRFASCWRVERRDGVVIRLTDHDCALTIPGDGTYLPMDGVEASARQSREGGDAQNFEVRGILSDDAISAEDLLAGRYREAKVRESSVDWRYPHLGPFHVKTYSIEDTVHDGREWRGNLVGMAARLRQRVGRKMNRTCDADFGDARCKFDAASLEVASEVVAVAEYRRAFTTTLTQARAYFNSGVLTWTSGPNVGVVSEVKNSLFAGGKVSLQLRTPFDVSPGDEFAIRPGCAKTYAMCKNRYDNLLNFRGFDTVPGNDSLMRTPDAK